MYSFEEVVKADPELAKAMELETNRQNDHIELIASENFVSKAVMAAMGSTCTNKYAEGYPRKRYYGGCQYVDMIASRCHSFCPSACLKTRYHIFPLPLSAPQILLPNKTHPPDIPAFAP